MIKVLVRYCAVIWRAFPGSSCGLRTESALGCRSRRRFGVVCLARRAFPIDSARAEGASGAFCREQDLTEAEAHVSPGTLTLYRNTCSLLLYCSAWKTSNHISRTYKATGLATPEGPQLNAAQLEAVTTTEGLRSRDRGCGYGQNARAHASVRVLGQRPWAFCRAIFCASRSAIKRPTKCASAFVA